MSGRISFHGAGRTRALCSSVGASTNADVDLGAHHLMCRGQHLCRKLHGITQKDSTTGRPLRVLVNDTACREDLAGSKTHLAAPFAGAVGAERLGGAGSCRTAHRQSNSRLFRVLIRVKAEHAAFQQQLMVCIQFASDNGR